jgi:hypothetical protein
MKSGECHNRHAVNQDLVKLPYVARVSFLSAAGADRLFANIIDALLKCSQPGIY